MNNLASSDRQIQVNVPGDPGGEKISSQSLARALAGRDVVADPTNAGTGKGASTAADQTVVNKSGLTGNLRGARLDGVDASISANKEMVRQLVIVHEGMHGTRIDNAKAYVPRGTWDTVHQAPFNAAAAKALGFQ